MTFDIDIDGRTRHVMVEADRSAPHRYRLTIDGVTQVVDAVAVDGGTLSLILTEPPGASRDIGVSDAGFPGELAVRIRSGVLRAVVNGRRWRRQAVDRHAVGEQRIVAPMPGKVLRVLVTPGTQVEARQPLVVVEAMKMENELSSPKPGRVTDVAVTEGESVEAGRLLAVVE